MDSPVLIEGGFYKDERGQVSFVNDFSFKNVERFYIVQNSLNNPLRAWQGHKLDEKNFFCIQGEFKIFVVKIDNWDNPSKELLINEYYLKHTEPKILKIPPGYANAVLSLSENAKLVSFSSLPLDQGIDDDVRYPLDYWSVYE